MPTTEMLQVKGLAMGEESSHCEGTPSTWTLAKDYLPGQLETTHSTVGINDYLCHWFRRLRDNYLIAAHMYPHRFSRLHHRPV